MLRLKELRESRHISQKELSSKFGYAQNTLSNWENGNREPDFDTAQKLADFFGVTVDYLLGRTDEIRASSGDVLRIPVYGTIPAGIPMEAIEYILDIVEAPADWSRGGKEYFALRVKGDSMSPIYLDGDTIIFMKTPCCDSGKDCCVMVNGSDATFKRVFINERGITLQPLNPAYEPRFFTNEEAAELPVKILGVVKELRRGL